MTTTDEAEHRVHVSREPLPGAKPWRAVVRSRYPGAQHGGETPVGRFDTQDEAVRAGISAARFVAAGIPWTVTE